jgi:hypothetical protein
MTSTLARAVLPVIVSIGLLAANPSAQSATGRFRHERPIVTTGAGHYRLAIDVPLLVGSAPFEVRLRPFAAAGEGPTLAEGGLADLRLFDATNREVPYLLVRPAATDPVWVRGALLPMAATKKTSGFEADLGASMTVDCIRVSGLPTPFLKRLVLEGSGDRQHWTLVAAEGTLFDLPDEQLHQLDLPLAAGEYRYLRVTWDDTNSGRVPLPATVEARRVAANAPARPASALLVVERRPSEPGRSRYVVRLPGPHLPVAALVLEVGAGHVLREAEVTEPRLSGVEAAPAILGRATLRRVVMGSLTASDLRIAIRPPAEAQLDLTIDDGDNAPLVLDRVVAEFAELPWIYLESDGSPLVARYGSATREFPRYDLEAVRDSLRIETAREAHWGDARAMDAPGDSTPGPLPLEGAPIDVSLFRHVREVPPGDAGLVALPLDAAVLAESSGPGSGFADVRIVNADGRQVPYLVERRNEPLALDLTLERTTASTAGQVPGSRYRLRLPFASLPAARLILTTEARVFDRRVTVGVERPPDRLHREPWLEVVATARWVHADRERPAQPLMLQAGVTDAQDMLVVVDEGDNQSLPLGPARLLLPSYRLRFYRSAGAPVRLAYGRDDLAPPRYDLALLAPQVLGVTAIDVAAGNDAPHAAAGPSSLTSPVLFWAVLGLAVIVLLGFVVRLLGKAAPPAAQP